MSLLRFFKKQRLTARGMSCGKTRRAAGENTLLDGLEESPWIRGLVVLAAAGILTFLCFVVSPEEPFKNLLYALLILAVVVIHPLIARGGSLHDNSRLGLFLFLILLQLGIGAILLRQADEGYLGESYLPLLVPYALAPLTLSVLLGAPTGFWLPWPVPSGG